MHNINASGSKGNCFDYQSIMIDCGVSYKSIKDKLKNIRVLLITHRHSDHLNVATVKTISKFHKNILIFGNEDVFEFLKENDVNINLINLNENINIDHGLLNFSIIGVQLYHDVLNYGFFIKKEEFLKEEETFFYGTDTYTLEGIKIPKCDKIFLECNYEEKALEDYRIYASESGKFDYTQRVEYTHLSFKQWLIFQKQFLKENGTAYAIHMSSNTIKLEKNQFKYNELLEMED